jgi:hypothetical protein
MNTDPLTGVFSFVMSGIDSFCRAARCAGRALPRVRSVEPWSSQSIRTTIPRAVLKEVATASTEPDPAQGSHGARCGQGQALRAPAAALTSAVRRARQWCKAGTEERPRPNKRTDPERSGRDAGPCWLCPFPRNFCCCCAAAMRPRSKAAYDPGCVKTRRGIIAPRIFGAARLTVAGGATVARTRRPLPWKGAAVADMVWCL